jgi:hypothetical protein
MPGRNPLPDMPSAADWERAWQKHWSKVGLPGYELPESLDGDFLKHTRTPAKERARLARIEKEFVRAFGKLYPVGPAVTVFGSARFKPAHRYYKLARSYGLNILLPHEQAANAWVDEAIEFRYFFTRKVCLVKYSCAFIVMPGGLGTLDELFEAATLIQCRKIGPFPLILMGEKFWEGMRQWGQLMMAEGVFARDEIGFGFVTDSPQKAVDLIVRSLPPAVRKRLQ